jgi:hypothetical protein
MKRQQLCQLLILVAWWTASGTAHADGLDSANARGSIGDISNGFVSPDGVNLDVMNNDFLGGTDKYMTGAMKFGYLHTQESVFARSPGDKGSFELTWNWRALTPTETESVGGRPLPYLEGRFADWMEIRGTYAETIATSTGLWKMQFSLGLGEIGNKGMKTLHRDIHDGIGMSTSGLEYTNQPRGLTKSADFFVGKIFGDPINGMLLGTGYSFDPTMREIYLQATYLKTWTKDYAVSAEALMARQLKSDIYVGANAYRYEFGTSLRVGKYYQPGLRYVSDFLSPDSRGQFYAELLRFNVPL